MPITMAGSFVEVTIPSGYSLSEPFNAGLYIMTTTWFHNSWTPAAAGLMVSNLKDGYYVPLLDEDGEYVQITYVNMSGYIAAFDVQPVLWAKIWSKAMGTRDPASVAQVNDAHILIVMK